MQRKSLRKALLRRCSEVGYTRIHIAPGEVWCDREKPLCEGWPALWRILEELGVSYGCGNGHQHQVQWRTLTASYEVWTLQDEAWRRETRPGPAAT